MECFFIIIKLLLYHHSTFYLIKRFVKCAIFVNYNHFSSQTSPWQAEQAQLIGCGCRDAHRCLSVPPYRSHPTVSNTRQGTGTEIAHLLGWVHTHCFTGMVSARVPDTFLLQESHSSVVKII